MCDSVESTKNVYCSPQCQHFVLRKKRLCRMTVKPGKQYCGEHEPRPKTNDGQDDTRIPCPYDPKHTCYASKLEKHLSICNARQQEQPNYLVHNINAPKCAEQKPRLSLSKIPKWRILNVIEKINMLFDTNLKDKIATLPEQPIHSAVLKEFTEPGRTESSLRHLRQASSLLHVVEGEGLVAPDTCYVELGAGKGQLSWYAWGAWGGGGGGRVLLVDRAAPRHKRDNRLRELPQHQRVRADLAHLALARVPAVRACAALVAYAKHLCGVATDYALRCVTARGARRRLRGAVLATCCHHRCERAAYPADLTKLGIDDDDFNILLGVVSWATSGDGRGRQRRLRHAAQATEVSDGPHNDVWKSQIDPQSSGNPKQFKELIMDNISLDSFKPKNIHISKNSTVQTKVSIETKEDSFKTKEDCIETKDINETKEVSIEIKEGCIGTKEDSIVTKEDSIETKESCTQKDSIKTKENSIESKDTSRITDNCYDSDQTSERLKRVYSRDIIDSHEGESHDVGTRLLHLSREQRAEIGRRAKALLDWGRVLYLQECGFDARLVYYVPTSVSLENVCIIATKRSGALSD